MDNFLAPYKDYVTTFIFSLFGGAAGYILRKGQVRSFLEFFFELLLSVFSGTMMFLIVADTELAEKIKYFFVAMAAMAGRETLAIFQKMYRKRIGGGDGGDDK